MKLSKIIIVALMMSLAGTVCHAKSKPASPATGSGVQLATTTGKVDLNSATQAELERLPGIGPAGAKKIIASRPYKTPSDLAKAGIAVKAVEKITPLVTVGAAPPAAAKPAVPNVAVPPPASPIKASGPATPKAATKAAKPVPPPVAGKGMVWVNTESKIYHKEGSRWYGKTKQGSYMTETEAIKAGYRAPKQGGKEQ
jgi:hypothetical protein